MLKIRQEDYIQQLSIDCVLFAYKDQELKVLVEKLRFKGDFWTLPGGFVKNSENLEEAATRIVYTRTGLKNIQLDQFYVFGDANRNSRYLLKKLIKLNPGVVDHQNQDKKYIDWLANRFVSIGYYAVVDIEKVEVKLNPLDETIEWRNVYDMPALIMDHNKIVNRGLDALRNDMDKKGCAFRFLPKTFTMKDVLQVYETVFAKKFIRTNFQKKILDMEVLTRLEKQYTGAANKAPYLYTLKKTSQ